VFRIEDLAVVGVVTADLDGTVATFRRNFGLPVTRSSEAADAKSKSVFLAIGSAQIEIATPTAEGSPLAGFLAERGAGLYQLVLVVDDLEAARRDLEERGIEISIKPGPSGKPSGHLSPAQTHGVRIALVER
jgi:methylmalonyl-CoA/ethylmalonyl-CoA epimerase